jgi:hypothetical protein
LAFSILLFLFLFLLLQLVGPAIEHKRKTHQSDRGKKEYDERITATTKTKKQQQKKAQTNTSSFSLGSTKRRETGTQGGRTEKKKRAAASKHTGINFTYSSILLFLIVGNFFCAI